MGHLTMPSRPSISNNTISMSTLRASWVKLTTLVYFLAFASIADQPTLRGWTQTDLKKVANAGMIAANADKSNVVSKLIDLSDAFRKAGNTSLAKEVLLKAVPLVDIPTFVRNDSGRMWVDGYRGRLVERLVQLGDTVIATQLVNAGNIPTIKVVLLGNFGKGEAEAGDETDALKVAASIIELKQSSLKASSEFSDAIASAITDISSVLIDGGKIDDALQLASETPDGLPKQRILNKSAHQLCTGKTRDLTRGQIVAEQAALLARTNLEKMTQSYESVELLQLAAEAIAECKGADASKSFLNETSPADLKSDAYSEVVNGLIRNKETDIARSISSTILQSGGASVNPIQSFQTDDPSAYFEKFLGQIQERNKDGVDQMLPVAIDTFHKPTAIGTSRADFFLLESTRMLAMAGYMDEAQKTYAELKAVTGTSGVVLRNNLSPEQWAAVKADMGDLQGALAIANDAGPLTRKTNMGDARLPAMMSYDNAKRAPTSSEYLDRVKQVQALLPPETAGQKAHVLVFIVSDMAEKGDIKAAWQAEAVLEADQSEAIKDIRDDALRRIAEAQLQAKDFRGAFATTMRIEKEIVRWEPLRKLAEIPASP